MPSERWDAWLDPAARDPKAVAAVLDAPAPEMLATPVGTEVNNVRNQGAALVEPAG